MTDKPKAQVVVFSKPQDPYGVRAKTLLKMKGIPFTEKHLPQALSELIALTGKADSPAIIINGKHIGGFDALGSLDLKGELDKMIF